MINIVIIAHSEVANSFGSCIEHILSRRVDNLIILSVKKTELVENISLRATEIVNQLNTSKGVLILSDIFGATPSNIASKLVKKGSIELITGLNLPMLVRAISYSNQTLEICAAKAIEGGINGIIHIDEKAI